MRINILVIGLIIVFFAPFIINPSFLTRRSGDASDLAWPNYYFIKDAFLNSKEMPLWNPYIFSGVPEIANPQSPLLYPPNILIIFMDLDLAIVVLFMIHVFIAFFFSYKLAKEGFKWNDLPAFILGLLFAFSPYNIGRISVGHISLYFAISLAMPIAYFTISLIQKFSNKNFILLVVFLAMQYLNYPTLFFYTAFFGSIAIFLNFLNSRKLDQLKVLLSLPLMLILIFPLFWVQFKLGHFITRADLTLSELSVPLFSITRFIKSIILPAWLLKDLEIEVWMYHTLLGLLLSIFAFYKLPKKFKLIFFIIAVLVLTITLGTRTPIFGLFVENIPGFSYLRVTTRDWFVFIFLVSILTAYFFQIIKGRIRLLLFALLFLDIIFNSIYVLWEIPDIMKSSQVKTLSPLLDQDKAYRYYCTRPCISQSEAIVNKIKKADGYHPLVSKDYQTALSEAGGFSLREYNTYLPNYLVAEAQPSAEKLGKLAVKWVISDNLLSDNNFIFIKKYNGLSLYQNSLALKRIRFEKYTENDLEIVEDSLNNIKIKTGGKADKLIVADSFFPGWKVSVNGERKIIERFNGWARAVQLPEGQNQVEFFYNPFY